MHGLLMVVAAWIANGSGANVSRYRQQAVANFGQVVGHTKDTVFFVVHYEFRHFIAKAAWLALPAHAGRRFDNSPN
jgi:hypothetical protein